MTKHITSFVLPHLCLGTAACAVAGLFFASCVSLRPDERTRADPLALRAQAALARRGLGADGLSVIQNILRHEALAALLGSQAALRSPCWRLQAAALTALGRLGSARDASAPLASFLR